MKEYIATEDMLDKKYALANCEELVRCENCEHWRTELSDNDAYGYCPRVRMFTSDNWYCADGERSEDE